MRHPFSCKGVKQPFNINNFTYITNSFQRLLFLYITILFQGFSELHNTKLKNLFPAILVHEIIMRVSTIRLASLEA